MNFTVLMANHLVTRKGTAVAILYTREGFAIATDSLAISSALPTIQSQKIFRITDRVASVLLGTSDFYETETGEGCSFDDFILAAADNLRSPSFKSVVRQVSLTCYRELLQAKRRMKTKLKGKKILTELIFAGFENGKAMRATSYFRRRKERFLPPTVGWTILQEPKQYLRGVVNLKSPFLDRILDSDIRKLRLLLAQNDPSNLPGTLTLDEALRFAQKYVEITIASGTPAVGGKIQLAKIPRDGKFSFVTPPL